MTKNDDGEIIEEYSLEILMESCFDFANEISELQTVGKAINYRVLATPKFHVEIVCEGVEYTWTFSKNWYRRQPLVEKKKKEKFQKIGETIVEQSICYSCNGKKVLLSCESLNLRVSHI